MRKGVIGKSVLYWNAFGIGNKYNGGGWWVMK